MSASHPFDDALHMNLAEQPLGAYFAVSDFPLTSGEMNHVASSHQDHPLPNATLILSAACEIVSWLARIQRRAVGTHIIFNG